MNLFTRFNRIITALIITAISFFQIAEGQTSKKYIFFNNFDSQFFQTAYYENFQKYDGLFDYAQYAVSAPFNDATFAQYNITDFDIAVFPMGDNALTYKSGGISVISKIKEMIAAGKNVLITGRQVLYRSLAPAGTDKDPQVVDFLTNTMGVNYIGRKLVHKVEGSTTTWWSYIIHGHDPDPVGRSVRKGSNYEAYNGGTPLAYYMSLDIFQTKDESKYFPVEHFIYHDGLPRNDTIVAIRTEVGNSRLILYSIGFESICGEIPRGSLLHRCMLWALGNIKPDGAYLQFDPVNLDFERVKVDSSRELDLLVQSIGKQDLTITETSFFDNPDDAFKIVAGEVKSGGKPVTIKTGNSHYMRVRFTPKAKTDYTGSLSIYSNSASGNIKDIICLGIGGTENSGPKIATNFGKTIDFGQLRLGKSNTLDLKFYNPGDKELTIQTCRMDTTMADQDHFTFAQVLATPLFVKAGDSLTVKVKFAATKEDYRKYAGKIFIECDALNDPSFVINLNGEVVKPSDVDPDEEDLKSLIMSVNPNPATDEFSVTLNAIRNLGNSEIYISDLLGNKLNTIHQGLIPMGVTTLSSNIGNLPGGVYFVVVRVNGVSTSKRLVIAR
jgi:hypothetical protein